MSTEYVILKQDSSAWTHIGTASAHSARSAIRERLEGSQQSSEYQGDGTYVAVPARSWQEQVVKTETKTQLRFS